MGERRTTTCLARALVGLALLWGTACASNGPNHTLAEPTLARASLPARAVQRLPRKTIAVARFDANGAFQARYGGWDLGGGLASQLATELEHSGHFIVVERAELSNVLREQELGLAGLARAQTAPRAGQLIGAQLLVRGSVTEFAERTGGNGFRISGPISGGFGGGLSARRSTGHVAIDLRVIDTTSGRVVATYRAESQLGSTSLGLSGVTQNGARFGYDEFQQSALGKATREAIVEAVGYMGRELADVPWNAQVAKVSGGRVYVNAGADANLYEGVTLDVYRQTNRVTDPYTGELLGVEEQHIGAVTLGHVEPRYATGTFSGPSRPRVGDTLRYAPRS